MTGTIATDSALIEPRLRRRFTKAEKALIVAEYSAAVDATGRGIVLRRWGTYQQNVSRWAKELTMASKSKTGSKQSAAEKKQARQLVKVEAELVKAREEIALLEELVEAQGKVVGLQAKHVGSPHPGLVINRR